MSSHSRPLYFPQTFERKILLYEGKIITKENLRLVNLAIEEVGVHIASAALPRNRRRTTFAPTQKTSPRTTSQNAFLPPVQESPQMPANQVLNPLATSWKVTKGLMLLLPPRGLASSKVYPRCSEVG